MNLLETLSQELTDLANRSAAWVVRVNGRRGPNATGVPWSDRLIITSNRAVHRESEIEIGLPSGQAVLARIKGRAPDMDFALVELEDPIEISPVPWTDQPAPGLALALARDRQGVLLSKVGLLPGEALVHRVAPAPEFLGSPLLSHKGEFLGLHLMAGPPGVVPYSKLNSLVEQLQAGRNLEPGYLGLALHQVEHENGQACLAIKVEGPAEEAGFKVGDIITALDDTSVPNPEATRDLLRLRCAGDTIVVHLVRAGETRQIEVELGARPEHDFPGQVKHHIRKVIRHFKHHHVHRHGPHHHGPPGPPCPPEGPPVC